MHRILDQQHAWGTPRAAAGVAGAASAGAYAAAASASQRSTERARCAGGRRRLPGIELAAVDHQLHRPHRQPEQAGDLDGGVGLVLGDIGSGLAIAQFCRIGRAAATADQMIEIFILIMRALSAAASPSPG